MCYETIQWFSCRCPKSTYIYCLKFPKDSPQDPNLCIDYSFANKHLPYLCPACSRAAFQEQWAKQDISSASKPNPGPESQSKYRYEVSNANSSPPLKPHPPDNNDEANTSPQRQLPPQQQTPPNQQHPAPRSPTTSKSKAETPPAPSPPPALHWLTPERTFLWQRHQQERDTVQQRRQRVEQEQERVLERERWGGSARLDGKERRDGGMERTRQGDGAGDD